MKNNYLIQILIKILFLLYLSCYTAIANDVVIDAKEVNILEKGNIIEAVGSVIIKDNNDIKITGDNAKYNKLEQVLEINGNVKYIDTLKNINLKSNKILFYRDLKKIYYFDNTEINLFDENYDQVILNAKAKNSFIDQNKLIFELNENVIIKDYLNEYEVFSEKILYNQLLGRIISTSETKINYQNNFEILTKNISFDKNKRIFISNEPTNIKDSFGNIFLLDSFHFDLNEKILKAKNIKLSDKENNELVIKNSFVDLKSNEIIGSDFKFKFNKNTFGNNENDPRLFGRYILNNKNEAIIKKGVFTTCKNLKDKCPTWSISANEVKHDKNKKRIEYKQAWVDIYDVPVAYFPFFFHPDPTVERQSGFLFPQFVNSSNLGFSTQIPYFKALDHNKDMTISPRIYSDNNLFLQTEYRQAFKNSKLITDFSYNKKNNSNSHFFTSLTSNYEDSFLEMKLESVSNKNYLKKYQIKSPIINSYSVLNSRLAFEEYSDDYSFSTEINVMEDLTKEDNDRFEFSLPNYNFNKETVLNNNLFHTLNFRSKGDYRKYNTNVDEVNIVNDFIFASKDNQSLDNLDKDFKFLLRNVNTYGDQSDTYKEGEDYKILGSAMLNLKYPLIKQSKFNKNFLTPSASFRYSPSKGANLKNEKVIISYQDLYKVDRVSGDSIEHGPAATLGLEYKNINKANLERLNFGIGINIRNSVDEDLPESSSLGKKTSDLIGYSGINITENFSMGYDFLIDENLSETNYSLASAEYRGNKFKTRFEYLEKSNFVGDESYLNNSTDYIIDKSNSLSFETNKNLDKNLTNYYNLIYQYKNDCLKASVVYNKQFYQEDSINSGKNIFFKISFIPFGDINTPNLK